LVFDAANPYSAEPCTDHQFTIPFGRELAALIVEFGQPSVTDWTDEAATGFPADAAQNPARM
jgi:hypothetical protein